MALIKCSECRTEVFEKAKSCPKCGNCRNISAIRGVAFWIMREYLQLIE